MLLRFEASSGICMGCKVYNIEKAQLCAGGVCELPAAERPGVSASDMLTAAVILIAVGALGQWVYRTAETARCTAPDFAKALGHEERR